MKERPPSQGIECQEKLVCKACCFSLCLILNCLALFKTILYLKAFCLHGVFRKKRTAWQLCFKDPEDFQPHHIGHRLKLALLVAVSGNTVGYVDQEQHN